MSLLAPAMLSAGSGLRGASMDAGAEDMALFASLIPGTRAADDAHTVAAGGLSSEATEEVTEADTPVSEMGNETGLPAWMTPLATSSPPGLGLTLPIDPQPTEAATPPDEGQAPDDAMSSASAGSLTLYAVPTSLASGGEASSSTKATDTSDPSLALLALPIGDEPEALTADLQPTQPGSPTSTPQTPSATATAALAATAAPALLGSALLQPTKLREPSAQSPNSSSTDTPSDAAAAVLQTSGSAPPQPTNGASFAASFAAAFGQQMVAQTTAFTDPTASVDPDANGPQSLPPAELQATPVIAERDLGLSHLSRATVETTALIAAQIIKKLDGRSTRFDMTLTPEQLGRVDVSLEMDSEGHLTARLAFDNPAAATDLRGRADELRRQLQEAGFKLADDALDFSQRDPSSGFGGGAFDRAPNRQAFAGAARLAAAADALPPLPLTGPSGAWASLSLTPDRVDVKV